jgi:hypothetical protein
MSDWMTWQQFQDLVGTMLPMDVNRIGLETFYPAQIVNAIYDLQDFIPRYRTGNEVCYYESDFVSDGLASIGTLPPFGAPRDCWITNLDRVRKEYCRPYPWRSRYDLVYGRPFHDNGQPFLSISPESDKFYLYPRLIGPRVFTANYAGFKVSFAPTDFVPYDIDTAEAVADFVAAHISRYIEHDLQRFQNFMQSYTLKKRNLFLRTRIN